MLAACESSDEASKGRVIVVGAGLAGLSAADRLADEGWEVVVLEARARVGGRVWTLHDPETGQYAEAGGEFLDSGHSEMRKLVDRFGLRLEPSYEADEPGRDIVYVDGALRTYEEFDDAETREQVNRYYEAVDELAADVDPSDPASSPEAEELDSATAADGLDELGITGNARLILENEFSTDYGVEADRLSQLFVVSTYAAAYNQPDSGVEIERVEGGNDQVAQGLAEDLGDAVRLGSPVTGVRHSGSGVEVTVTGGEVVEGDWCLLAAPLPALRGIGFTPGLPAPIAQAIGGAQYGPISKTLLQYPYRFWREEGLSSYALTDTEAGSTWEATTGQPGRPGVLTSYASGDLGLEVLDLSDDRLVAAVSEAVTEVFPGRVPDPIDAQPVRWPLMPYSGGAYVAWAPGQLSAWYGPLRAGTGRLRFAGEHTAELSGYMEGAVRSGLRAARQIDSA